MTSMDSITEKVTQQVMFSFNQMQSQMQPKEHILPPKPEVGPSTACVSTKGSCFDPSGQNPNTDESDKCGLMLMTILPTWLPLEEFMRDR